MFPKLGEGFFSDVSDRRCKLRLFSAVTALGWVAAVFDLQAEQWLEREWVENAEEGMKKAAQIAGHIIDPLPPLTWNKCG